MKGFMEEYGYTILTAIAIAILLSFVTPLGNYVKVYLKNTVYKESQKAQNGNNDNSNSKSLISSEIDKSGNITIVLTPKKEGLYVVEYSIKHNGLWSEWNAIETFNIDENLDEKIITKNANEIREMSCGNDDYIKFRSYSSSSNMESNILQCSGS